MPSTKSESLRKKQAVIREAKRKAIYEASLSPAQKKIMSSKLSGWDQFVWGMPTYFTAVFITLATVMLVGIAGSNIALNAMILIGVFALTAFSSLWVWNKFTTDKITFTQRIILCLLPSALGVITVLMVFAVLNVDQDDIFSRCALSSAPLVPVAIYAMLMRAPKRYGVKRITA